jgi:hypothetical protein
LVLLPDRHSENRVKKIEPEKTGVKKTEPEETDKISHDYHATQSTQWWLRHHGVHMHNPFDGSFATT